MFTSDVPVYTIDLKSDEESRWREVITREANVARRLAEEAASEFAAIPEVGKWLFAKLYQVAGGLYKTEIDTWARSLGISSGMATMLNCTYELSHVSWKHTLSKIFGCTAGVRWIEGLGMVHTRNLDWPFTNLGNATCLFRFQNGPHEFVSVGIAGFVGVLSGMVPGRYSATINWAPPLKQPKFDFGPVFLLRQTLEECNSYDEAIRILKETPLSTGVFFTVCGVEKGQACVIERTQSEAVVREIDDRVIVQANHYVADRFVNNNMELLDLSDGDEESSFSYSCRRALALKSALSEIEAEGMLESVAMALDISPALNENTYQQMIFCPATGDFRVWRRLAN